MDLTSIIQASSKPLPYTPGTAQMWVDEYISTQLLKIHLDQQIDLASRNYSTIDKTVSWILQTVDSAALSILDLGCGPGLYTERLASRGHQVTGIDFSANSITHAIKSASQKGLNICYRQQDYLTLTEENQYDLVMMIFTDFGVLDPGQRCSLLEKIQSALKPGGVFILDVLNRNANIRTSSKGGWELAKSGFWRPTPYIALNESFYYENEDVTLNQHLIIEESGDFEIYRFWVHCFSHTELDKIFRDSGFANVKYFESVLPDSELCKADSVTFCTVYK